MSVAVLTYQVPHRKTYDTLCLLRARGYADVRVIAVPLTYTKRFQPLVQHRPDMSYRVPKTHGVCEASGYRYEECPSYEELSLTGPVLVCGAGLLPKRFIQENQVINSHPGLIPFARGLDALKWALLEGLPVGATTHLIGDEVDAGEIIERREVDVRPDDTVLSLGLRVYAEEIDMLVGALNKLDEPHNYVHGGGHPVHRRMPHEIELEMLDRFERCKAAIRQR